MSTTVATPKTTTATRTTASSPMTPASAATTTTTTTTTTPPARKPAWGSGATASPSPTTSFADILSHELATKLDLDESESASVELARRLARENGGADYAVSFRAAPTEPAATTTTALPEDVSGDLALAMQLQEEELAAHAYSRSVQRPQGNVTVVSRFDAAALFEGAGAGGATHRLLRFNGAKSSSSSPPSSSSSSSSPRAAASTSLAVVETSSTLERDLDDDELDAIQEAHFSLLGGVPESADGTTLPDGTGERKPNCRLAGSGAQRDKSAKGQGGENEIITKHDATITGRRNARRLERHVDGVGALGETLVPTPAYNSFQHRVRRQGHQEKGVTGRTVEKETFQTRTKGLDMHTRLILHRMLDSGLLDEVVSIVRTGKEAVVYHALGPNTPPAGASGVPPFPSAASLADAASLEPLRDGQRDYAIKVFKTTLTEFRNRDEYIAGDFRFRDLGQISKAHAKKIVTVWAEKELKNLTRLHRAGLPVPEPVRLDQNVLVMDFIGEDGWGAPTLADYDLASCKASRAHSLFLQVMCLLRSFYSRCNLVHADLSEYNVLVTGRRVVVLDVGQAVERGHPRAGEFLRRDVRNVLKFFESKGVGCASTDDVIDAVCGWVVDGVVVEEFTPAQREWVDAFCGDDDVEEWMDRAFAEALAVLVG